MNVFLKALQGQNREGRPPIWLMRQAGRYLPEYRRLREKHDFLELATRPELIAKVTLQPIERFQMDAAILFSDILMVLKCFAIPFHFEEGKGPIVSSPSDYGLLPYLPPEESLDFVKEGIKEIKSRTSTPLIGFAGAPLTVASYIIEGGSFKSLQKTKQFFLKDKKGFLHFLDKITDATIDYLKMQKDAGVDALQLFDSWAGMLAYTDFQAWILPIYEKILKAFPDETIPLFLFCKGSFPLIEAAARLPFSGFSVDSHVSLSQARTSLKGRLLQGNLDPEVLALAPPEIVEHYTQSILREMALDPRYIFNLGHGILPTTPLESVYRLVETVQKWPK